MRIKFLSGRQLPRFSDDGVLVFYFYHNTKKQVHLSELNIIEPFYISELSFKETKLLCSYGGLKAIML